MLVDMSKTLLCALFILFLSSTVPAADALDMYVIDTEGGKALLVISPSGQSMLMGYRLRITNDQEANGHLHREYRQGWTL